MSILFALYIFSQSHTNRRNVISINPGINTNGALARTGEGKYVGETSFIKVETDEKGDDVPTLKTDILGDHFLQPKPVMFAHSPLHSPKVIAVSCGSFHIVVVARDPLSLHGKLYTSGINIYGQLGHGDLMAREKLTLVRRHHSCCIEFPTASKKPLICLFVSFVKYSR